MENISVFSNMDSLLLLYLEYTQGHTRSYWCTLLETFCLYENNVSLLGYSVHRVNLMIHLAYLLIAKYRLLKLSLLIVHLVCVCVCVLCRCTWLVSTSSLVRSMKISVLPPTTWTSPTSREWITRWDSRRTGRVSAASRTACYRLLIKHFSAVEMWQRTRAVSSESLWVDELISGKRDEWTVTSQLSQKYSPICFGLN